MLSLLIPTRNRPSNVERLLESLLQTSDTSKIELCFYIDEDDELSVPVIEKATEKFNVQAIQGSVTTSRPGQAFMHNELSKIATNSICMVCADDIVFRDKGWDKKVYEVFDRYDDKIVLTYANDKFQGGAVPVATHGFIHKNWIEIIGYLYPPMFNVAYTDTWVTEVSEMIGRRIYLENVTIEHIHPAAGKAEWDDTYKNKKPESQGNETALYSHTYNNRLQDAEKLKSFIKLYKEKYE